MVLPAETARTLPMGAIYVDPVIKRATINRDECVESMPAYNGLSVEHMNPSLVARPQDFPFSRVRFDPEPMSAPRRLLSRMNFNGHGWVHAHSQIRAPRTNPPASKGRGTEEVKTNDVTYRVKRVSGLYDRVRRPGVGVWLRDIQMMTCALAEAGVAFEKKIHSLCL